MLRLDSSDFYHAKESFQQATTYMYDKWTYLYKLWFFSLSNNSPFFLLKYEGLQNLIQRNQQLYSSVDAPSGGVALPFILVQVNMIN